MTTKEAAREMVAAVPGVIASDLTFHTGLLCYDRNEF